MDISGFDNIIYTTTLNRTIAFNFIDIVRSRWPGMSVDLAFHPETMDFIALDLDAAEEKIKSISDEQRLELFFMRDSLMRAHREQHGYALTGMGDGPFALYVKTRDRVQLRASSMVDVDSNNVPTEATDPYPAWVCSPSLQEVAIVTPGDAEEDRFSQWLLESTLKACVIERKPA